MSASLLECLDNPHNQRDDRCAVEDPASETSLSYGELRSLTDRVRDRLVHLGVEPGDRVGFCLGKSIDSIAAIFGILKAGAAYVPTDASAPMSRSATIFEDCRVKALIADSTKADKLREELSALGHEPTVLVLDATEPGIRLRKCLDDLDESDPAPEAQTVQAGGDDLAYILYTSGSTGKPKGVILTHENGKSYVDWCTEVFAPTAEDRFSSHAPLHFDLSILDIYTPLQNGGTLVLISEALGKDPIRLAPLIEERRITCWYSTPSILTLLYQYGKLEERDLSALRIINFAGEVFPIKHLRALHDILPEPRYLNLYGPTETNVCTFYELPAEIPEDRTEPFPIGETCSHCECIVIDTDGQQVEPGQEGELCAAGAPVTQGYWNLPERTAEAFHIDDNGRAWYRTGDLVTQDADGNYIFQGRRDRMIKKRGYRIELGEIEACLYQQPEIDEAAVVAATKEGNVVVTAFFSLKGEKKPGIIALKSFCAEHIPAYMIPDRFVVQERLPRTSTDKVDYQSLLASLTPAQAG